MPNDLRASRAPWSGRPIAGTRPRWSRTAAWTCIWYRRRLWSPVPTRVPTPGARAESRGHPVVGLRFAPGMGPAVLGVPATELRDQRVWLDELWGREVAGQWSRLVDRASRRGRALEDLAGRRLTGRAVDRSIAHVADASARGSRVDEIARDVGWSERTLRRRCDDAFGYGPKVLGRILRFQRAAGLVRSGAGLSDAAATCGLLRPVPPQPRDPSVTGAPCSPR